MDGGIHICTEKSKCLCLAHGWRCIWKAHQQNQLCLGVLCASRRSFVKSLGDDLSSWAFKNRFSCIFLAKEKCFLSNQNEACGLILSPKTQVCSWTFHDIDSGRFLQCAWLYSSIVNGENFLRQSESVCFDWLHPAVVLACSGGRKKFPTRLIFWYLLVFSCYLLVTECHCSRVQDPQSLTPGHKSLQETQTALFLSCRSMPPVCISVWIIIKVWELASVLLPSADSFWLFWKYFSCTHTVAVAVIQSLWKQSFLLYLLFA